MIITVFDDPYGFQRREIEMDWDELVSMIRDPDVYPSKAECPLIKLGRFGDKRSEGGSLKHDANLLAICGVEGDYDAGDMEPAEASRLLKAKCIPHVVYTSASHAADAPRWRVLCPLSCELASERRLSLVEALNGALGGVLTPESFRDSQAFYFGAVEGVDYAVFG